jgi:hypothetical protein
MANKVSTKNPVDVGCCFKKKPPHCIPLVSRIHTNHPKMPFKTGIRKNVIPAFANMIVTSQSVGN